MMEMFEGVFLNCIYLLFPLSVYIIATAYIKNIDKHTKNIFLDLALLSSIYFLFRYGYKIFSIYPMIIFNIPLLIGYLKQRKITSVVISILLIIYYHHTIGINYSLLIIEYLIYYIIYNYSSKNNLNHFQLLSNFVCIKAFIMSVEMFIIFKPDSSIIFNFVYIFCIMMLFTIIASICLYLLNKGEEIIDLNSTLKALEKEKKLRMSLFKITHEIKNPIAVCKGYLDMLDYDDTKKIKKYIPIVKDEIARTLILMDDFLDYTKIEIEKEETDLYMLLEDTCDITKPLFKSKHININFEVPDDELYLELDYNRMKQVFVNIFKNSIEAKDKTKVDNYLKIDVLKAPNEVIIKIKDNGIGMDKKTLDRVDEMFYTTKEKGTGLGVALSKEIINLHNGTIKYSSIKGKYTLVTIKLPLEVI